MEAQQVLQAMKAKLQAAGIPFEDIKVFGAIRCNVHVLCVSRDTADKWAQLLSSVFKGAKVFCGEHAWDAKDNRGTVLRPTKRHGFLIAVAA